MSICLPYSGLLSTDKQPFYTVMILQYNTPTCLRVSLHKYNYLTNILVRLAYLLSHGHMHRFLRTFAQESTRASKAFQSSSPKLYSPLYSVISALCLTSITRPAIDGYSPIQELRPRTRRTIRHRFTLGPLLALTISCISTLWSARSTGIAMEYLFGPLCLQLFWISSSYVTVVTFSG